MKRFRLNFKIIFPLLIISFSGCRDWFGEREFSDPIISPDQNPAQIQILTPEYGSVWKPGDSLPISWTATGTIQKIKIELYRKSSQQFIIVAGADNTGFYTWDIPQQINNSVHYVIKISSQNNAGVYALSRQFSINNF
jgi:hypothetical protein